MKAVLVIVIVLLVGIAGFGFYQGWFRVSTEGTEQQPSATITVDKDKIRADETSAKDRLFGPSAEEEPDIPPEEVEP